MSYITETTSAIELETAENAAWKRLERFDDARRLLILALQDCPRVKNADIHALLSALSSARQPLADDWMEAAAKKLAPVDISGMVA